MWSIEESDLQAALMVRSLADTEGVFESPINININETKSLEAPLLEWYNHNILPKKMKITNTGHTIILSAKWKQERLYLTRGPLLGKYVFSQLHFHWGANNMEGSEHTIDGSYLPGEMHVVFFKSCYLTQESALKEKDGIVVLVYMLKLQDGDNPDFQVIVDALNDIKIVNNTLKMKPMLLTGLVRKFDSDYFLYWGSVNTSTCIHYILWLITRTPTGVSMEQIDALRSLLDVDGNHLLRNFRKIQPRQDRHLLHVNPSQSKIATLLPEFSDTFVFRLDELYNALRFRDQSKTRKREKRTKQVRHQLTQQYY